MKEKNYKNLIDTVSISWECRKIGYNNLLDCAWKNVIYYGPKKVQESSNF